MGEAAMEQLEQLEKYLADNQHLSEANQMNQIKKELVKGDKRQETIKRLRTMCSPGYLGNLAIKEFSSVYEWWNFLESVKRTAEGGI